MAGTNVCNKCGTNNETGAKYCSKCGIKIGSTAIGRFFRVLTKILVGIFIFIGLIIGIAFYATSGVANTVKDQLSAIRSGDYTKAYSYTSTEFQKNTSVDEFKKFIETIPALKDNQSLSINDRSFQNENGSVKGTITSKDGMTIPIEYQLIKENGTWKILGINAQLSNDHKSEAQPQKSLVKTEEHNEQEKLSTQTINLSKTYQNTDNAFLVKYPENWELDQSNPSVIMFKKMQDEPGFANVNIQLVLTKQAGGKYANIDEYLDSIKSQGQAQFTDFKVVAENTETLPSDPDKINGKSITFTYKHEGTDIKQLQIILMSEDNKLFYMWGYTASSDQYDKNLPVSDAMLDSWKFKE
ncbi:MAG: DUF4864 domain-containing protein [Proteobacteria bacterium]|nr:DUF4864 domain-containing protein [Pseudomonadota bacterium]